MVEEGEKKTRTHMMLGKKSEVANKKRVRKPRGMCVQK
jgi:hypothetical protein